MNLTSNFGSQLNQSSESYDDEPLHEEYKDDQIEDHLQNYENSSLVELSSFLKPSLNPEKEEEADAIFSSSSEDGMEDLDEQSKPQIVP